MRTHSANVPVHSALRRSRRLSQRLFAKNQTGQVAASARGFHAGAKVNSTDHAGLVLAHRAECGTTMSSAKGLVKWSLATVGLKLH